MQFNYAAFERHCREIGKSPSAVAEEAGVAKSQPGKWQRGEAAPSNTSIRKLANYFDIAPDVLLLGDVLGGDSSVNIRDADNSVVVRGSAGAQVVHGAKQTDGLTEQEEEVLRIFRELDMRTKNKALTLLYELEDGATV